MHRTLRPVFGAIITRRNRRPSRSVTIPDRSERWLIGLALIAAGIVAGTALSGSYQHQYELLIREGQQHWVAGMQPLSVEGLIACSTLLLWFAGLLRRKAREVWPAYLVLAAGLGQAALMNLASDHHYRWGWIGPEIAIWPAVAFFAGYEMAVWMVRNRPEPAPEPEVTVNEGQTAPDLPPTPAEPPEPEEEPLVTVPRLILPEYKPMVNGVARAEPEHTCNDGKGPRGGKKTPGCPRCDALLSGTIAPKGGRR